MTERIKLEALARLARFRGRRGDPLPIAEAEQASPG